MAESDRKTSPYVYGFNDPIRHTDPDGMFGEDINEDDDRKGFRPKTIVAGAAITTTPSILSIALDAIADIGSGLLQRVKFGVSASATARPAKKEELPKQ